MDRRKRAVEYIMTLLERCSKNFSLWLMKTAYKGANSTKKQQIRNEAGIKGWKYILEQEFELADLWYEFYNWIVNYEK